MSPSEVITMIQQVRRDQPRNQIVMAVCDACENLLRRKSGGKKPLTRAQIQKAYRERKKQKTTSK